MRHHAYRPDRTSRIGYPGAQRQGSENQISVKLVQTAKLITQPPPWRQRGYSWHPYRHDGLSSRGHRGQELSGQTKGNRASAGDGHLPRDLREFAALCRICRFWRSQHRFPHVIFQQPRHWQRGLRNVPLRLLPQSFERAADEYRQGQPYQKIRAVLVSGWRQYIYGNLANNLLSIALHLRPE